MTKYASGMVWGEGPRWRDGALWLSDTQGAKLWTDASGVWAPFDVKSVPNGLWFLPDGRLVGAMMHEQRIGVWTGTDWETYADLSHLKPGPLGDLVGDRNGNLYVDDVAYALHKGEQPRPGRLIFVTANRESSVAADDLMFPNGLAFLEDGKNSRGGRDDCEETHVVPRRRSRKSLWSESLCRHGGTCGACSHARRHLRNAGWDLGCHAWRACNRFSE